MTVSKVAVIALVAIVAVPIIMGYAFNLNETTITDYKKANDSVNVTELLQNGTAYTYAHADSARLNTFNTTYSGGLHQTTWPVYESFSSIKSSLYLDHSYVRTAGSVPGSAGILTQYAYCGTTFVDSANSSGYLTFNLILDYGGTNTYVSIPHILAWVYIDADKTLYYQYYAAGYSQYGYYTDNNIYASGYSVTGTWTGSYLDSWVSKTNPMTGSNWVDISKGFHFEGTNNMQYSNKWSMIMPDNTRSILFTINLDSITAANYKTRFEAAATYVELEKTTTGGNVSWRVWWDAVNYTDLYYDPARSDNTYQVSMEFTKVSEDSTNKYYNTHIEYMYVGGWPTAIGASNYYMKYIRDIPSQTSISTPDRNITRLQIDNTLYHESRSPTIRLDDAYYRAFEYPVISNQECNPASFRNNPATTINDTTMYGDSISFGGNTYTVSGDKLNIGTHQVPIKGMVFSSEYNYDIGGYDNKIGNTIISNTAVPSTITFNGNWSASITVQSMESYSYTKTEWEAGEFAWDGMDQNFLICGLITCLGAFIGCGIYAKKTRSGGIIPVMIVCGGAALMFFLML